MTSHTQSSIHEDPNGVETPPPKFTSHPSTISKNTNTFELKMLNNQFYGINREPSSITSHSHADNSHHQSPPSSEEEKLKMTRQFMIIVLAISYAMFLVTFALIVFIGNAVVSLRPVPQIFSLFMLTTGFIFFIFLLVDVRLHISRTRKIVTEKEKKLKIFNEQFPQSDSTSMSSADMFETSSHVKSYNISTSPPHHNYCFVSGRHGENLYLKLGAAWFCFGLLIHSILSMSYQIIYIRQNSPCADILQLTVDVMFPLYSLFILFFIFKYCNVVINCKQSMAKIMLMHAMGTTLAFWIYSVVNETVNAINLKNFAENTTSTTTDRTSLPNSIRDHFDEVPKTFSIDCPGPEELNIIYRYIEPYLYPFVVEFCILTVGIYYMMWSNINNCSNKKKKDNHDESIVFSSLESIPEAINTGIRRRKFAQSDIDACHTMMMSSHEEQIKSSLVVYADCHASSRGLFAGMLLMIFKIVSMILVHVTASVPQVIGAIVLVDRSIELLTLLIMIVTTVIAYTKTSKFDINHHPMSILDDVLLFIAIPAFFSETIFSMVPAVYSGSILNILVITAQLIQILIQTPWIIDALRRCSNSQNLRRHKPGRELVTFLTIANVALWIYYTFTIKTTDVRDERYKFYGDTLWSILNHLSLPLIMFYRFHASVCLVDVWKHSYEKGDGH